ncbi:hypothetical protein HK098_004459 [Nowakowskiella sp. JEL0407]|nr:hypothetical protein HK098_004459 [Nowakowskiella sp. JEL0407]
MSESLQIPTFLITNEDNDKVHTPNIPSKSYSASSSEFVNIYNRTESGGEEFNTLRTHTETENTEFITETPSTVENSIFRPTTPGRTTSQSIEPLSKDGENRKLESKESIHVWRGLRRGSSTSAAVINAANTSENSTMKKNITDRGRSASDLIEKHTDEITAVYLSYGKRSINALTSSIHSQQDGNIRHQWPSLRKSNGSVASPRSSINSSHFNSGLIENKYTHSENYGNSGGFDDANDKVRQFSNCDESAWNHVRGASGNSKNLHESKNLNQNVDAIKSQVGDKSQVEDTLPQDISNYSAGVSESIVTPIVLPTKAPQASKQLRELIHRNQQEDRYLILLQTSRQQDKSPSIRSLDSYFTGQVVTRSVKKKSERTKSVRPRMVSFRSEVDVQVVRRRGLFERVAAKVRRFMWDCILDHDSESG